MSRRVTVEREKFEAVVKRLLRAKPIKRDDLRVRRPAKAKSSR